MKPTSRVVVREYGLDGELGSLNSSVVDGFSKKEMAAYLFEKIGVHGKDGPLQFRG